MEKEPLFERALPRFMRTAVRAPAKELQLSLRNIFIMPSRRGWLFIALIAVIWLVGTNYQNNLVIGFSYLLAAVFLLAIIETFRNLQGLKLSITQTHHNFLGSPVGLNLRIQSSKHRDHFNIRLGLSRYTKVHIEAVEDGTQVSLHWHTYNRGRHKVPNIRIWSRYPLHLLHAWSWFNADAFTLTYPKPVHQAQLLHLQKNTEQIEQAPDVIHELREYRPGDYPKHIAWKHYARNEELLTKIYSAEDADQPWLELDSHHAEFETALSHLCYWVLHYSDKQRRFGVILPTEIIPLGSGEAHRQKILAHLANYYLREATHLDTASPAHESSR